MTAKEKPIVLVVEPDYMIADLLQDTLNGLGCDVYGPLATTDEALAVIEDNMDAAFLTLSLDDPHAYRLAETLDSRHVPFGFATGYQQTSLEGIWQRRPYVRKPFSPEEIKAFLLKILPLHNSGETNRK